jgi:thiamine phosphate synthase YjbQ (UPF0047 family)
MSTSIDLETRQIDFSTNGYNHILDITEKVQQEIVKSGFVEGQVTLFGVGSTTGISTLVPQTY